MTGLPGRRLRPGAGKGSGVLREWLGAAGGTQGYPCLSGHAKELVLDPTGHRGHSRVDKLALAAVQSGWTQVWAR